MADLGPPPHSARSGSRSPSRSPPPPRDRDRGERYDRTERHEAGRFERPYHRGRDEGGEEIEYVENVGTVYVGALSHDTDEASLRNFFETYGRVVDTKANQSWLNPAAVILEFGCVPLVLP